MRLCKVLIFTEVNVLYITRDGFKLMDNELVVANSQKVTAYGVKNGAESWSVDAPWQE